MDLELIEKLIHLLEASSLNQLEVEEEGLRVSLQKSAPETVIASAMPQVAAAAPVTGGPAPAAAEAAPAVPAGKSIDAPMVGTFYRAPAPDAPPYVEVGDSVTADTVVCILEAMKVMNEIKAGMAGTIEKVMVENAQPVEFGQPLFVVKA